MDFLNDFDPSDDENNCKHQEKPTYLPFKPNFHEKYWYRNALKENQTATAITEIDLFRVADCYHNGDFECAENILTGLRESTKNNRTHEIMLIDSLLQCSIKKTSELSSPETSISLQFLSYYESILVDFGDQIQFLRTKAFLLSKLPFTSNYQKEFKNTMALLCQLCGSFENWQLFEIGSKYFTKLEMFGLKLKMKKVLKYEIDHSKGFIQEKLKKRLEKITKELNELEGELESNIIESIHSSINSHKDTTTVESTPNSEFRAHESRSKNKLIPVSDQPATIEDFFHRFPFLSF
ncbi:Cytochrome Oxidase Assembly subunits [Caenorhabditis elegans]|uniref:Cytochrome Oxidase Assembly subunits n=1 Tax=Caenorhabditis elegans TaxID=6239 RepID=O01255_CAEEL|nr:Cytochrome Oxidase Assembly subunits [Caenorhabditis elegans]CAA92486.3 Cytochrome Oxidase Assembly subunits [Caenorhabditis elegans]|eukprot:NP_001023391.1 Cytochrome Oxidase Assembly subunits [Caenorhabditis elegans]